MADNEKSEQKEKEPQDVELVMRKKKNVENEPTNAAWGERYFHIREQDGYQLSFVKPIEKQIY
jgi:hypothetical protein